MFTGTFALFTGTFALFTGTFALFTGTFVEQSSQSHAVGASRDCDDGTTPVAEATGPGIFEASRQLARDLAGLSARDLVGLRLGWRSFHRGVGVAVWGRSGTIGAWGSRKSPNWVGMDFSGFEDRTTMIHRRTRQGEGVLASELAQQLTIQRYEFLRLSIVSVSSGKSALDLDLLLLGRDRKSANESIGPSLAVLHAVPRLRSGTMPHVDA